MQPSATTRRTERAARAPIWRASASDGRAMSGAGSCSRPMKTSGRPVLSRRCPSSRTRSVGGGRYPSTIRTAVEVWACSLRLGNGPVARIPPASQTMRIAWPAPTTAPATRSNAPRRPAPRACDAARPVAAPSPSPRPTSPSSTESTTRARNVGGRPSSAGVAIGRTRNPMIAPAAAPPSPASWGRAPDRAPRTTAATSSTTAMRSTVFTARRVTQPRLFGRRPRPAAP